jgi:hypothetical protein
MGSYDQGNVSSVIIRNEEIFDHLVGYQHLKEDHTSWSLMCGSHGNKDNHVLSCDVMLTGR